MDKMIYWAATWCSCICLLIFASAILYLPYGEDYFPFFVVSGIILLASLYGYSSKEIEEANLPK